MPTRTWTENPVHPAREGTRNFASEDLWRIPRVGTPVPSPDGDAETYSQPSAI